MASKKAQTQQLADRLRKMGCEVAQGGGGHLRVTYRGAYVGALSSTPSDEYALKNTYRKINRRMKLFKQTGLTWR